MKKTRVLLAAGLFPPDIGGPSTYAKLIVEELSLRNFSFKVVPFRLVKKWPKIVRHFVYFGKLVASARGCDLIYALDPVSVGVPALLASWLMGKSFVLRVGGDYAWEQSVQKKKTHELLDDFLKNYSKHPFGVRFLSAIQKFVAREAMCVIVPSEYLRSVVLRWGVPAHKVITVYNVFEIPHGLPSKEDARRKLGLRGRVMVSVGRLVPWKGFDLLIEILPGLIKQYPDLVLHILGDGPKRQSLENLAEKRGVAEKVIFHGAVPHSEVLQYMRAGDVYALNTAYEGLSHQLLEAMVTEVPIVTTSLLSNAAVVRHGKEALLVSHNDRQGFMKAIQALLDNPHYGAELAVHARRRVGRYEKEHMLRATAHILKVCARM